MLWCSIDIHLEVDGLKGCRRYVASPPGGSKARYDPSRGPVPRADYLSEEASQIELWGWSLAVRRSFEYLLVVGVLALGPFPASLGG
jgi:hypothetical protein